MIHTDHRSLSRLPGRYARTLRQRSTIFAANTASTATGPIRDWTTLPRPVSTIQHPNVAERVPSVWQDVRPRDDAEASPQVRVQSAASILLCLLYPALQTQKRYQGPHFALP